MICRADTVSARGDRTVDDVVTAECGEELCPGRMGNSPHPAGMAAKHDPRENGGMSVTVRPPFQVLFVCTGNICRSPMAEVVLRRLADDAGLGESVNSVSAGTGDWHVGERADRRTVEALARRGYDGSRHRARQFGTLDFEHADLIIALDRTHERVLRGWAQSDDEAAKVALLLSFDPDADGEDVPDPYYADSGMFDEVLGMIEVASQGLFDQLRPALLAPAIGPPERATGAP